MNLENIPEQLFELIQEKSFEQLSDSERSKVLKMITAEDYFDFHALISDFNEVDRRMEPEGNYSHIVPDQKSGFRISPLQAVFFGLLLFALGFGMCYFMHQGGQASDSKDFVESKTLTEDFYPDDLVFME